MILDALYRIANHGQSLSRAEAHAVMTEVLAGQCTDAQIAALPQWQASTLFDDKERSILGYVEQMTHGGDVDDPTFAALEKNFTPQQIVELTYTIGNYYANGLLTKALRIQVETDGRETVAGKC